MRGRWTAWSGCVGDLEVAVVHGRAKLLALNEIGQIFIIFPPPVPSNTRFFEDRGIKACGMLLIFWTMSVVTGVETASKSSPNEIAAIISNRTAMATRTDMMGVDACLPGARSGALSMCGEPALSCLTLPWRPEREHIERNRGRSVEAQGGEGAKTRKTNLVAHRHPTRSNVLTSPCVRQACEGSGMCDHTLVRSDFCLAEHHAGSRCGLN